MLIKLTRNKTKLKLIIINLLHHNIIALIIQIQLYINLSTEEMHVIVHNVHNIMANVSFSLAVIITYC